MGAGQPRRSHLRPVRCDGVLETECARSPSVARADAANLSRGLRFSRAYGEIHRLRQIELAVAVAVRAGKAEVCRRRRVKDRHLRRRNEFAAVTEFEIHLQRGQARITRSYRGRREAPAALAFTHRLPSNYSRNTREPHGANLSAASTTSGAASGAGTGSTLALRFPLRSIFSCWRFLRDSSRLRLAWR